MLKIKKVSYMDLTKRVLSYILYVGNKKTRGLK